MMVDNFLKSKKLGNYVGLELSSLREEGKNSRRDLVRLKINWCILASINETSEHENCSVLKLMASISSFMNVLPHLK